MTKRKRVKIEEKLGKIKKNISFKNLATLKFQKIFTMLLREMINKTKNNKKPKKFSLKIKNNEIDE